MLNTRVWYLRGIRLSVTRKIVAGMTGHALRHTAEIASKLQGAPPRVELIAISRGMHICQHTFTVQEAFPLHRLQLRLLVRGLLLAGSLTRSNSNVQRLSRFLLQQHTTSWQGPS